MAEAGGLGVGAMIEQEILQSYKSRLKPEDLSVDKLNEAVIKLNAKKSYGSNDD